MAIKPRLLAALALAASCLAGPAQAHFQLLYVPETTLHRGENLEFAIVFTHPYAGGPVMAMPEPRAFDLISRSGVSRTDLRKYLRPVQWHSQQKGAAAYRASIPRDLVRTLGDHVFVLEPAPYLEAEEGLFIQQITKVIVNVGGVPGAWSEAVGLPAEIQPLNKPYANWTGGVFRGVVLSEGKPVPFAKVEIEYLNHAVDLDANALSPDAKVAAPHPAFEVQSAYADAQGVITVGLPRAGWWGIAALSVGPTQTYQGKQLSQDAVLWIQAKDIK